MIEPGLIEAFQAVFKFRPITVRADDCLNRRHRHADCTRCVEACPTQAITLEEGAPHLLDSRCVNCGICLHECPTDVFLLFQTPEADLLRSHIELPGEPVGVVCLVHQSPEESTAPVSSVIRHRRCLAGFSTEQLLSLSADGERPLWLDDSYCSRCPLAPAHHTIVATVRTTNQLLSAFGREPVVHTLLLEPETATAVHPVHVLESDQPELSRRGLFKMMTGKVQQQATEVIEHLPPPKPAGSAPVEERLPHRVPPSRRRLHTHLAKLAAADAANRAELLIPTADLPYGNVLIEEAACTACELCARFCPTGAMRFETQAPVGGDPHAHATFDLSFRLDLCLDCNICVVACPEEAVSMDATIAAGKIVAGVWEVRVSGELVECSQCGTPTRFEGGEDPALCSVCRRGGGGVHKPGADAELMSDFFRHLRK